MENRTQEEAHKTQNMKNITKSILMHKLRSNANQTKMMLENQMTTLQPKFSVSTSSLKVKKCVTPEPLQQTPSWITRSGVISKAATAVRKCLILFLVICFMLLLATLYAHDPFFPVPVGVCALPQQNVVLWRSETTTNH